MRTAERYYCYALQLEPVEPYAFLQLSQVVKDQDEEGKGGKRKKKRGSKRKVPGNHKPPYHTIPHHTTLYHTIHGFVWTPITDTPPRHADILKNKDDEGLDRVTLQKRVLLHDRVNRLCELRKTQMKTHLQGLCTPGKFVYFEPFWLEQYMECFNECEDWAWMLKCSHEFRTKSSEKKE
jgi:hypothetical protein